MDHKADIIITSDMHIKLVGMVTSSKTTWPKIFQIKRENLQTRNGKTMKKQMMTKKTMTMKQTNKLLLQQLKGTGHYNQKPDIM